MLSIIIPTKDEPAIQLLIDRLHARIKRKHEIIVVDKSAHAPKLRRAKLIRQKSNGLAKAFLEGLGHARGNLIALMDGDLSHRPEDLAHMLRTQADIVIGSRFLPGARYEASIGRKAVSRIMNAYANLVTGLGLSDPMSGFMLAKASVLKSLKLDGIGYKIVLEICYKARKRGYKIAEVPIKFSARRAGKTKVGFNLRGAIEVLNILWLSLKLVYSGLLYSAPSSSSCAARHVPDGALISSPQPSHTNCFTQPSSGTGTSFAKPHIGHLTIA